MSKDFVSGKYYVMAIHEGRQPKLCGPYPSIDSCLEEFEGNNYFGWGTHKDSFCIVEVVKGISFNASLVDIGKCYDL